MNDFFRLILSMSLSGSILVLFLFAVMPLTRERFPRAWQYYIWLVVVLRLLIPYSPDVSLVGSLFDKAGEVFSQQTISSIPAAADAETAENRVEQAPASGSKEQTISHQPVEKADNYLKYAWMVWISGVFLGFVFKALQYRSFMSYIRGSSYIIGYGEVSSVFRQVADELRIKKKIPLYRSSLIESPMVIGIIRPVIVIPENFLEPDSLGYVFRHELIHYKRCDLWYKWLVQFTACIHWFNPLVHIMSRRINKLCEFSCDEAVSGRLNTAEKKEYCSTIIKAAAFGSAYRGNIVSATLFEEKKYLKERMCGILRCEKKSVRSLVLSAVLAVALCCIAVFLGAVSAGGSGENPLEGPAVNTGAALKKVIIDPGHGGNDPGVVYSDYNNDNPIEINEKEQTLKIASLLRDMLEESGIDVELTRQEDKKVTLEERMKLAEDFNASLFVSIHLNAGPDRTKRGTLTMYNSIENTQVSGTAIEKSAQTVHYKLVDKLSTEDAGVAKMPESLKYSKLEMPALIVDLAFMTNESDRRIIMAEDFEIKAAKALHEGILSALDQM